MISINGKIEKLIKGNNTSTILIEIPSFQNKWVSELDFDKQYKIEIKEVKSKKSLAQNNFSWQLMTIIARNSEMFPSAELIYMQLIKMAHIQTVFIETIPEAETDLLRAFRCVVERDTRTSEKGVLTKVYECYYGMSYFDKEDMNRFIECLLLYAQENGIDIREYEVYL